MGPRASPELGDGDFGPKYNKRTGRPIRRVKKSASPFVDSAVFTSGDESSDEFSECEDTIKVRTRKRKRSPSPPLSDTDDNTPDAAPDTSSEDESERVKTEADSEAGESTARQARGSFQVTLSNVTINVPAGHKGRPITIQLNLPSPSAQPDRAALPKTHEVSSRKRKRVKTNATASPSSPRADPIGFLDLPPELRNDIYRLAFVTEERLNFRSPTNFSRSAAFLRTCHQVHNEARSILYSENKFLFARNTIRYGSFWEDDWSELGFRSVRRFLKIIGPDNAALVRHVAIQFEDATPCLNPPAMTHEDRRFVNDGVLMSVLRHLANYTPLQTLRFNFNGRRRVDVTDERLLSVMKRIKADEVKIVDGPIRSNDDPNCAWSQESKQSEPVRKVLLKAMVRKHKLYD